MRLLRASLVSQLLLCLLTSAVNAQSCPPLQGVQATLEGAQNFCRTSTGGIYTATEYGGGTSTHQWVYGTSSSGPWTPIAGATGTTYRLTGSDFPSTGMFWIAVTSTPQCGSPVTGGAQSVNVYDTLPAPEMYGNDQICADATNAIAQSAAQWDSYSWSITHGTLIPGSNGCGDDPTKRCVSFRPDGTGEVHLSLTVTAGSCSSNALRAIPIVETAPPLLDVWSPVCPGGQGSAITSQFPTGVRTWSVTNAHIDVDFGDHIVFTANGNGPVDVTLTFTDTNGCSSTSTGRAQLAGTKPVITLGSPACSSNGTASANGGWNSYDWSITNGTITYGQGTANVSFSGSGSGPMVLTVTGRANYSTFSCTTASDPVTVPTVPTPTITLATPTICPFGTDTATAPAGYANYWWSVNNGYIAAGDGTNSIRFSRGGYPNNPNDPITITLYVADANGCSAPQATATVPTRTIPSPTITLDTPDICPYGTNTATVPAQYANYWWSLNNGYLMSGDGTNSIRFSRGGYPGHENEPITVTLYVQDADGCPAPQATVTVPTRTIDAPVITLGTPDICPYGTNTATVPAQYANYWWSLNNGYLMSGDGTNSIRFSRGGYPGHENEPITIILYVQDANGCPAPQATVTVPTRTIAAPVITLGTPDICQYGTDTATVPAEYANYWWSLNNGYLMSGDGTNSIRFSRGGYPGHENEPITITLYVQDANGCPAPQSTVTVPTRTIAAPVITLGTPDICKYGTNTATVPAQYANYSWSLNNGSLIRGDGTNSITFSAGGGLPGNTDPTTITLYVQDANGCPAPPSTVTVPIRNIPAPTITLATPDTCKYGTNTATVPAQYANYSWSLNNGSLIRGDGTNSITFSAGGGLPGNTDPTTITLYVQDANGCPAPPSTVTVPVRTIPPPTITLATPDVCPYGSDTASVPAQYANYSWSMTGGVITGGSLNSNSITFAPDPMQAGPVTLSLYVQDGNGCPALAGDVVVPIRTIAPPVITANGSTSLCGGGSVTLTAPDGFSYSWSNGATTRAITVTQPGDYFVTVSDTSGCRAVSTPVHVTAATPSALVITTLHDTTCLYGSIQATISNPSLFSNITWSAAGGSIVPNGASSWTEADNGTVSQVSITAHATDVATGCAVSGTVVIPIVPLDPPVMTVSSNGPICYGTPVTISIPPQPAGSVIIWDYTGVKLGGGNGQPFITLSAPPSPSFSLRVRLTDPRSCSTQNTIIVPVHLPVVPVLQADDRYGCAYAEKTVTVTNPSAYTSFTWSVTNGTIIGPNNQPTVHIGLMGPGVNTDVTFTASDGTCPIYGSAGFYSTQPTASISGGSGTYCTGTTVTLNVSTDAPNATYLWSNGATSSFITATAGAPGPYTVTVTNAYGCSTTSAPRTVQFAPQSTTVNASGATTFCAGGSVTLTPAMFGDSYLWSNGATTRTIDVTQSGAYSVTVTSASCQFVSPVRTVTVNPLPAATITSGGPTTFCAGGSVTLTASAGSTYAWSNGATTQAITVTGGGSYSVTVTNASGCSATSAPTVVTVNANPTASITASGPTTFCAGGSVTLTALSAASYLWSTGATTQSIAATTGGNYSVTVTNANGCSATSSPTTVTVNPVPAPHIVVAQQYTSLAPSNFILAQVSGGNSYTYCGAATVRLFAMGGGNGSLYHWNSGQQTASIDVTQSGVYTVTITNAAGCPADDTVTININPIPTAAITASGPLDLCPNGGSVVLTANVADSYLWSTGESTRSIVVTQAGAYHVAVTTGGCTSSSNDVNVTIRSNGVIAGGRTFCPGGSVTLTAPAGTSFAWNSGATTQSITVSTNGDYSVTVTDATGCAMTPPPATVTGSSLAVSVTASATTICEGQTSTLTANPSGGTGNYSYQWFNAAGPIAGATAVSYSASASDGYYVVATDAGGCSVSTINQAVILHVNPTPAGGFYFPPSSFCSGGTNTVSGIPFAGVAYAWTVTNGTLQSTSGNSAVITAGTSGNVVIGLTVTNSSGCTWTGTRTVPIVQPPAVPGITASGPTTLCQGDQVTLTAPAGYSYTWRLGSSVIGNTQSITTGGAGSYTVTVTNANGCSTTSQPLAIAVNALSDATITAPSSVCASTYGDNARVPSFGGSYAWTITGGTITSGAGTSQIVFKPSGSDPVTLGVTVTNANGCAASSTRVVDVHSVPKPAVTPSGAASFCDSGVLTAPAGYTAYSWKRDGGQIGGASAQTFVATQSGTYSVIVFDATNCWVESDPVSITVSTTPVASISAQNNVCAGSTYGAVSAGTAASYQWSVTNGTIVDGQGTNVIHYTSGATGNVTLTLTVANTQGCSATQSINIPIANVQATITPSGPLTICPGGSVTLTASAGTSYIWSNSTYAQSITVTQTGSYSVRVFDGNGCYAQSQSVTVSVASPSASITPSGPTTFCAGGSVTLSAPAGYSYTWSTGATTQSITVNQSNTYSVTVHDANGCAASSSATVTVNPLPQVSFSTPGTVCGTSESAQEVQPIGTGLTYNWSVTNGAVTQNAGHRVYFTANAGASQVVLTVTITDTNGCSNSGSITLPVHTPPSATITPSGPTTFCAGGSVTLTAPAGMSSYSWSTGATTQSITVSTPNSYSVTVRDASFCSSQSSPVVVTVNPLPAPTITASGPTTFCAGGSVTLTAPAGYSSYLWNTGATTPSITVSSSNNYSVTVRDGNNCSGISSPTAVTVRPLPTATVSGTGAICPGGSATITATLTGTAPWTVTWSDSVTQTINSGTTASRSVSPATTKTYTVTSLTDANCTGTSSGSATVTVKTLPTAAVSGGGAICPGASATITATLTGTAPFSVTWSDNVTQTINSGTTASRTVSPAATTTYTVTSVSDAASCPRAGTGSATVTRNAAASITTQPSNVTTTRNTNVTLSVVAAGTAPISYQWFNGNGTTISGATSSSYTTSFTKKGTNTFYVEVWNACNTTHVRSTTVTVTVN